MKQFRVVLLPFHVLVCAAVLPLSAQLSPTINELPSREFGHARLSTLITTAAPNLVEGRELWSPSSVAIDGSSPPILYVADTRNNRVLAWRDAGALTKGDVADKVIGQRDFFSTFSQGPGRAGADLSTGLASPTAVTLDRNGNLYVADAGNNRILRYPRPLAQTSDLLTVDLVIGQKSVGSGIQANEGQQNPSEKTLFLSFSGGVFRSGLAFDGGGNLWVSDAGNNRVLRFPASQLAPNTAEPGADLVLGQADFVSRAGPQSPNNVQTNKMALVQPSGLAFDQAGRLYVCDAYLRVLQFVPPFGNGFGASRVLGLPSVPQPGQPPATTPNGTVLGLISAQGQFPPEGVVTLGNTVFVFDTPNHRIVRYDPPEQWPTETQQQPSPPMRAVIGQTDLFQGKANRGLKEPSEGSLATPLAGAFNGTDLWVVDSSNNRVLGFAQQGSLTYGNASRVAGQIDFPYNSPNLIEGRELSLSAVGTPGGGMVVDRNSDPPRLYIADTLNNRILGFRDARVVRPGDRADLVIGQPDFFRALVNYPNGDPLQPSDSGLFNPTGLVVDAAGDLLVADTGNGRLLRFPSPFNQPPGALQRANLVLGQASFTAKILDASSATMNSPWGVALFFNGSVAVSDTVHNRVLLFRRPPGGDFTNGQPAVTVFGQPDFTSSLPGNADNRMNSPRHIAADTSDRLYVCDSSNSRLQIFTSATGATSGANPAFIQTGLNNPQGVFVSSNTGEIWVTDTNANRALRFPEFQNLILNPGQANTVLGSAVPVAVTLDGFDNVLVAEASNRVSLYFAKLSFKHGASYDQRWLAPGMLAYLERQGRPFSHTPAGIQPTPWPKDLVDLEVFVDSNPAPIFATTADRVYIQVPMNAPNSGASEFQVVRRSTGEILAVSNLRMGVANPGFFTIDQSGCGQVAAINNDDNSINGPTNPVGRGKYISFYLTGQGFVPNAPADGESPSAPTPMPIMPRVLVNNLLADSDIQYSGLGAFPGGWQINVKIPETVPPGNNIRVAAIVGDIVSDLMCQSQRRFTTISVK